jgi:hypothetical protein
MSMIMIGHPAATPMDCSTICAMQLHAYWVPRPIRQERSSGNLDFHGGDDVQAHY